MSASNIRFQRQPGHHGIDQWKVSKTRPPMWLYEMIGLLWWSARLERYVFTTVRDDVEFDEGDLRDIAQHLDHETSAVRRARRHK